ncbi:MAG: hypothetical protein ACK55Z_15055 [bacterium]
MGRPITGSQYGLLHHVVRGKLGGEQRQVFRCPRAVADPPRVPLQVVTPDDHVYYPVLLMGIGRWPGHFREHRRCVRWHDCRAGVHCVLYLSLIHI